LVQGVRLDKVKKTAEAPGRLEAQGQVRRRRPGKVKRQLRCKIGSRRNIRLGQKVADAQGRSGTVV